MGKRPASHTTELEFESVDRLAVLLAKKKISPVELTRLFLSRIERLNPELNAYITVAAEGALADARKAEQELMRGNSRGPLHGIPVSLKDNIWTRGIRTTVGSAILRDFIPPDDATVVKRLRRAGAVILGKTNLHEFAYGITSNNPHFGAVHNPWSLDRIPGGSSGGSAAALAAGLCAASVGSDTGGSIRIPSAMCGTVGLKPTFGRVSIHGVVPLAPSYDHAGPMARRATDAALLLGALAGRDPLDPTSASRKPENFVRMGVVKAKSIRLGRPREYFWTRLDPEVRRLTEAALKSLETSGAAVEDISLPTICATPEASTTIALAEAREVHEKAGCFPARAAEYGSDVRAHLERGGEIRAVDYLKAQEIIRRSCAEFATALERVNAIVAPGAPIAAPPIGSDTVRVGDAEETVRSALVRLSRPANFTGLPAIAIPCGFTRDGLPVSLQLIGRAFDEAMLVGIARLYEQQHDWHLRHPAMAA